MGADMIDSKQAAEALADIDDMVHRVRQSRVYDLASQMMILWGVLVFAANIATWLWPQAANYYLARGLRPRHRRLVRDQRREPGLDRRAAASTCGCCSPS